MTERDALIILNAVPGLGSVRIRQLIEYFGSAKAVLTLKESVLKKEKILPQNVIGKIIEFPQDKFLKNEYNLMDAYQVDVVTTFDEAYPEHLREIYQDPIVLYYKGQISCVNNVSVAVVGSRRASLYGQVTAESFAVQLAERGLAVVSGMARGIDSAAHRGAMKAGGDTIAVLGCGLSHVYPPENKGLFAKISQHGLIFSEFPMAALPLAQNFPRRNRIISGLSLGVLVVEAARKSGALITSRFALEQGREVFAIPGLVGRRSAQGTNKLIQDGAKLVMHIDDILEEISLPCHAILNQRLKDVRPATKIMRSTLSGMQLKILEFIKEQPVHIDNILLYCDGVAGKISDSLLKLEMNNFIKQLPGHFYVRA
ncbi:MAG: DNA-processing protein DprA [Candidatus Omnitrophica bacterium]|nr:DNA-processing protein DprA [Candidatus Omnitrophota bacterium]